MSGYIKTALCKKQSAWNPQSVRRVLCRLFFPNPEPCPGFSFYHLPSTFYRLCLLFFRNPRLKNRLFILGLIFLLALAVRIGFILTLDNSVDVWGDWWDDLGWKLASGQGFWVTNPYFPSGTAFYSWRAPGFPLFLSLMYRVFGHGFLAAKIGIAVVGSLTALVIYGLCRFFVSEKASVAGGILYAVYPAAIFWTGYLAPETLTTFLLLLSLFMTMTAVRSSRWTDAFTAGVLLGFTALTRSGAVILIPVLAMIIPLVTVKKRWVVTGMFFLGGVLTILPWTARNYCIHHAPVAISTEGGVVFYIANNEYSLASPAGFFHAEDVGEFRGLSEVEADRKFYAMGLDYVRHHPGGYARLVADRFLRYWRLFPHTISGPGENYGKKHVLISFFTETPLILLGLAGIMVSLIRWRPFLPLYAVIFMFSFPYILIRTAIRYRLPVMGIMLVFACFFFQELRVWKRTSTK